MARKSAANGREFAPEAIEFGRRLQREMVKKQWSQSDLARAAGKIVPGIERYHVSHWVRGQHMPTPVNLDAVARALCVAPSTLVPAQRAPLDKTPFAITALMNGRASLRIDRTVSMEAAMQIIAVLQQEDK